MPKAERTSLLMEFLRVGAWGRWWGREGSSLNGSCGFLILWSLDWVCWVGRGGWKWGWREWFWGSAFSKGPGLEPVVSPHRGPPS